MELETSRWSSDAATTAAEYGGHRRATGGGLAACNQSVAGHEELPHIHNCVMAYTLLDHSWTPYHQTVCGFIHPVVVTATMITNCLVCAVLLRPSMRSPTSTLLVAMAFSDTLTGLLPTPCYLIFYGFGLYEDWVPFNWCLPYQYFTEHLPTVFHTASVWLTVALAAQRYIHVCHPGIGKRVCTVPNMLRAIAVVYALAVLIHLPRLLETRVDHVRVASLLQPGMVCCNFTDIIRLSLTRDRDRTAACLNFGKNISAKSVHLTLFYVTALTSTNHHFTVLRHHVCT